LIYAVFILAIYSIEIVSWCPHHAARFSCPIVADARFGYFLDAQRQSVMSYLNGGDWKLAGEYVEIESGRKNDCPLGGGNVTLDSSV